VRLEVEQLESRLVPSAYYVSPTGSDANNGLSPSTPWQHLSYASTQVFQPGDELLLKAGSTFVNDPLTLAPGNLPQGGAFTVGRYGTGSNPVLSTKTSDAIDVLDVGNVTIQSLTVQGPGSKNVGGPGVSWSSVAEYNGINFINDLAGPGKLVSNLTVTGVTAKGFSFSGIEFTAPDPGAGQSAFNNVTIQGCTLTDNVLAGTASFGPDQLGGLTINNDKIYANTGYWYGPIPGSAGGSGSRWTGSMAASSRIAQFMATANTARTVPAAARPTSSSTCANTLQ
jgi:hypothetical protein